MIIDGKLSSLIYISASIVADECVYSQEGDIDWNTNSGVYVYRVMQCIEDSTNSYMYVQCVQLYVYVIVIIQH